MYKKFTALIFLIIVAVTVVLVTGHSPKNANSSLEEFSQKNLPTLTYESKKLGIRFRYPGAMNGLTSSLFTVHEKGNTIFILQQNEKDEDSQYSVSVFKKDGAQDFETTLKTQWLINFPHCHIELYPSSDKRYISAGFVGVGALSLEQPLGDPATCPVQFAHLYSFFVYDTQHPDRYIYQRNTNDPLLVGASKEWVDTIELF